MSLKTAIIRPCDKKDIDPDRPLSEQKVCLYSKKTPGKLLGRHPNEESARKQEAVIQIHKHATECECEEERTANLKALQTYLLYEVAKHIINYAKGKRLQKPAEKVWNDLFSKTFKVTTRGPLKRGQEGGQYKVSGSLIFTRGDTNRPIELLIVAAYWKFKMTVLFQLKEKNGRKPIFSVVDKDVSKVVKSAKEFIAQNLVFPPIKAGDRVSIDIFPHKGRVGVVQSYQPFARRVLVRLDPVMQDDQPVDVWFDRDQVTLMTTNMITRQFQAAIAALEPLHPDLAQKLAKAKEQYKAKTALEKMIGEMVQGQSGIWLDKKQMALLVLELHKQGITEPKDGTHDEIAQAVGKLLDKLIPDAGDKKEKKKDKKGSLHPLTLEVFKHLQRDHGFIDAHKNDVTEPQDTWFKLDYVDDISVKKGHLVLGTTDVLVPNYVEGEFDTQDVDIIQVHPILEGKKARCQSFDVLTIPAFGDVPPRMYVDFGSKSYLLKAETAPGLAAQIYVASLDRNFLSERLAVKIEVEVEIDLGDLLGTDISLDELEEEDESDSTESQESSDSEVSGPGELITEEQLRQFAPPADMPDPEPPVIVEPASEPMVLDPEALKVAPVEETVVEEEIPAMEEPDPIPVTDIPDPRFPPVPFRWD